MHARTILSLVAIALATGACRQHANDTPSPAEDPDWIRLEIPKGRVANAVFGSLDGTLVVTTYKDAYYTTDKGATWHKTFDFATEKQALVARHDTLIALNKAGLDVRGHQVAVRGDYYSPDLGRTWKPALDAQYYAYGRLRQRVDSVQANGVAYQYKLNYSPVAPGSNTFYSEPSDLVRSSAGRQTTLRLPAKHVLRTLYLDAQNRLYVTAASCEHRNSPVDCADCQPENGLQSPAVVYVSRKPLP